MTHEELHEMFRKRMERMEELKHQQIQFIEFESYKELIPFLESLFKLKPSLITSFSIDKFRIVIENYTGTIKNQMGSAGGGTGKKP
jgi:ribosomal protein S18